MAPNNPTSGYNVGFGKPPKHSRFRTGTSGNPAGRPKGTKNLASVLERTLREEVIIRESGVSKTVTKLEAAIQQLVKKAVSGDLAALRQLVSLVSLVRETAPDNNPTLQSDSDRQIMNRLLEKMQNSPEVKDGKDSSNK